MKWILSSLGAIILIALAIWSSLPAQSPDDDRPGARGEEAARPRPPRNDGGCPDRQGTRDERGGRDYRGGGPGGHEPPPPPPPHPLEAALDLDGDREVSAEELAKAPESLKKADKNGDGKLDRDELRPPGPPP